MVVVRQLGGGHLWLFVGRTLFTCWQQMWPAEAPDIRPSKLNYRTGDLLQADFIKFSIVYSEFRNKVNHGRTTWRQIINQTCSWKVDKNIQQKIKAFQRLIKKVKAKWQRTDMNSLIKCYFIGLSNWDNEQAHCFRIHTKPLYLLSFHI